MGYLPGFQEKWRRSSGQRRRWKKMVHRKRRKFIINRFRIITTTSRLISLHIRHLWLHRRRTRNLFLRQQRRFKRARALFLHSINHQLQLTNPIWFSTAGAADVIFWSKKWFNVIVSEFEDFTRESSATFLLLVGGAGDA